MKQTLFALALATLPLAAPAQEAATVTESIVTDHILPRFEDLAAKSAALAEAAQVECAPGSDLLRAVYGQAFDAWVSASHLRFGPTETGDRAFALAFWPDSRGATPKALGALIADQDPIAETPEGFADVSIAARGFYALEFLLYDPAFSTMGEGNYHCTLIRTMTADIAAMTAAISRDWTQDYAERLLNPTPEGTYHTADEVRRELFKALSTGLEFTADTRLGRPLGTFDRPRPTRAEAWRSGRSARHVELSLLALRDLAERLAASDTDLAAELDSYLARALKRLAELNDPVFAGVAEPQSRLRVEVVQQNVATIRTTVRDELGPELGVAAGFNSLDGD